MHLSTCAPACLTNNCDHGFTEIQWIENWLYVCVMAYSLFHMLTNTRMAQLPHVSCPGASDIACSDGVFPVHVTRFAEGSVQAPCFGVYCASSFRQQSQLPPATLPRLQRCIHEPRLSHALLTIWLRRDEIKF